jgi:ubiquinone/menaquinone biosynthesis C-methylase UbiE
MVDHWLFYKPGDRVLDLGFGAGLFSVSFARSGVELNCCDPSRQCVERARTLFLQQNLTATFQVCEPECLPYPAGHFDAVASINLLEVSRRPDLVLKEIARVLRPGGRAIIVTFIAGTPWSSRVVAYSIRHQDSSLVFNPLAPSNLINAISESGLRVDAIKRRTRFLPVTLLYRKVPWLKGSSCVVLLDKPAN